MTVSEFLNSESPIFYHLTPVVNKEKILREGLKCSRENSGDGNSYKGIYVSRTNDSRWLSAIAEGQKGWNINTHLLLITINAKSHKITWEDIAPDLHSDVACKLACKITKDIENIETKDIVEFIVGNSDITNLTSENLTNYCSKYKPNLSEILCPSIKWADNEM